MTWFMVIAGAMLVIALMWIMPALLRRNIATGGMEAAASNLAILKDQLAELERDVANGTLSQRQYQQARQDLERSVLEDVRDGGSRSRGGRT